LHASSEELLIQPIQNRFGIFLECGYNHMLLDASRRQNGAWQNAHAWGASTRKRCGDGRRGLRHAYSRGARFHQNYQVRSFDASVAGVSNISATFPGSRGIGINPKWPLTCLRTNVLASGSHAQRLNSMGTVTRTADKVLPLPVWRAEQKETVVIRQILKGRLAIG
jgi:hypothetical protein